MVDETVEYKMVVFRGKEGEDFHLCALRLKTALRDKELIRLVTDQLGDFNVNENALSTIIPAQVL